MKKLLLVLFVLLTAMVWERRNAAAVNIHDDIKTYLTVLRKKVKAKESSFKDFSVQRGEQLFVKTFSHPNEPSQRSCTTCHTNSVTAKGSHHVSGKAIEPLAPSVNPKRLTSVKKMKKWFRRNCKWVMQGECSPKQKGDFITYLLSI